MQMVDSLSEAQTILLYFIVENTALQSKLYLTRTPTQALKSNDKETSVYRQINFTGKAFQAEPHTIHHFYFNSLYHYLIHFSLQNIVDYKYFSYFSRAQLRH